MGCFGGEAIEDLSGDDKQRIRGCTDVLMLIIFILFWFLLILIAAFALVFGHPKRLTHGYDDFGNICGAENDKIGSLEHSGLDMRQRPYLFYLDISNIKKSLKICVSKCPDRDLNSMNDLRKFYLETNSSLCQYDFKFEDVKARQPELFSSAMGPCPVFPVYKSIKVLKRCVPQNVYDVAKNIISNTYGAINSWDAVEHVLSDLYATWPHILVFSLLAFVFSLITISFVHFLASIVAWIFMIVISIASLACTGVLWWTYATIKWDLDAKPINTWLIRTVHNEQAFLIFSIVATILTIILLLVVFVMRKHVGFISNLFKESAKCMSPIITFLILVGYFAFWLTVAVFLATANYTSEDKMKPYENLQIQTTVPTQQVNSSSIGFIVPRNYSTTDLQHKSFTRVKYTDSTWVKYMWWAHLIGLIWNSEFILASQQMVLSGAVASWYFKRSRKDGGGDWFILQAIRRLICYHMGSVALGSFLITLFKIPRIILMYIQTKLKANSESDWAKCLLKSCTCCFYLVECFIRFMNHNAYAVIAMQGHNFCTSAKIAFNTIMNNVVKFTTLNSAGDFILFLGKCIVTLSTTIIAVIYLKHEEDLHFYAVPVLITAIFSFFIAHAILSLYEAVIDTLFLCLCEDSRLNKDSGKWKESLLVANSNFIAQELAPMNS
ncbi:conserved hypothetical protein [Pediculus humanus corporis]|uniref:Choline transporter-like protein n=1 Tax=Pediculus humanus subsp. corporis TaxID=121224 RepID=E0VNK9_PEDHC|nr:uncharacterized protein Phum_PHUM336790 [Pediculus humanus corporis]EEB14965.1 conserved hypothetical protein [Pediculus humanus corporis]